MRGPGWYRDKTESYEFPAQFVASASPYLPGFFGRWEFGRAADRLAIHLVSLPPLHTPRNRSAVCRVSQTVGPRPKTGLWRNTEWVAEPVEGRSGREPSAWIAAIALI